MEIENWSAAAEEIENLIYILMHHYTTEENIHLRLDHYLTKKKPDLTRAFLQKLIKEGHVFVNHKKTTKPGHKLNPGDQLIINFPSLKEIGLIAENIPLQVVYEDENIIVVNKAPGMVVHPTDHGAHISGTLVNALMHYCKDLSGIGGEKRPGIVHRLDKDTSGLMMVAKNDQAHHDLSMQIQERSIQKQYLTLLKGYLIPKTGSIEAPLIKEAFENKGKNIKISSKKGSKYALTHYKVLDYLEDYSLVEVTIVTGRTHQIRVHFAAIGHPVAGDDTYGDLKTNEKLKKIGLHRQFLHAWRLGFQLPVSHKKIELEASLPEDLEKVLRKLKEKG